MKRSKRWSDEDVARFREEVRAEGKVGQLAAKFGISYVYACQIANGRIRREAGGPVRPSRKMGRLSDPDVVAIREMAALGRGSAEIAGAFGINVGYVSMITTGRIRGEAGGPIGNRHGLGKLRDTAVPRLREMARAGRPIEEVAREFGISVSHAREVATGRRRGEIEGPVAVLGRRQRAGIKVTPEVAREIREMAASGRTQVAIAGAFGISRPYVGLIVTGRWMPEAGGPITRHVPKLSDADVEAIRRRAEAGSTPPEVARDFSISVVHARRIILGLARILPTDGSRKSAGLKGPLGRNPRFAPVSGYNGS